MEDLSVNRIKLAGEVMMLTLRATSLILSWFIQYVLPRIPSQLLPRVLYNLHHRIVRQRIELECDPSHVRHILVVALNKGIGDAVLYQPALIRLRRAYPKATIHIVVRSYVKDILLPGIADRLIFYDQLKRCKLIRILREKQYNIAIDLAQDLTSAIITFASGANRIIGSDLGRCRRLLDVHIPYINSGHIVDYWYAVIEACGVERPTNIELLVSIDHASRTWARMFLSKKGAYNKLTICIHPGARDSVIRIDKRWPMDSFAELSDRLIGERGIQVVFVGSADEQLLTQSILSHMKYGEAAVVTTGRTSVRDMVALIDQCDLFIGNNSGPLHIAVALGKPTISFGGGIDLIHWAPYGDPDRHIVLLKDSSCERYLCRLCVDKGLKCLCQIAPERVLQAIDFLLDSRVCRKVSWN